MAAHGTHSIYIASPLGFHSAGRLFYDTQLLPAMSRAGLRALDPWDATSDAAQLLVGALQQTGSGRGHALRHATSALTTRNVELLDRRDGVLAVLDGTDVDSGTAAEIGYAYARSVPIVGIRMDLRRTGEPGAEVNAQVQHFIEASGGQLLTCEPRDLPNPTVFLASALASIAACVGAR